MNEGFKDHFLHREIMSEDDDVDDEVPVIEEGMETMDVGEEAEVEIQDPLEVALERAEKAEMKSLTRMLRFKMFAKDSWLKRQI